jgi:hypothetical protein
MRLRSPFGKQVIPEPRAWLISPQENQQLAAVSQLGFSEP